MGATQVGNRPNANTGHFPANNPSLEINQPTMNVKQQQIPPLTMILDLNALIEALQGSSQKQNLDPRAEDESMAYPKPMSGPVSQNQGPWMSNRDSQQTSQNSQDLFNEMEVNTNFFKSSVFEIFFFDDSSTAS